MFPEDPEVEQEAQPEIDSPAVAEAADAIDAAEQEAIAQEAIEQEAIAEEAAEQDTLTQIEERILRAIELVNSLRKERDAAIRQMAELREEQQQTEATGRTLSEEVLSLKAERKQVRSRLERLLSHIDQLS